MHKRLVRKRKFSIIRNLILLFESNVLKHNNNSLVQCIYTVIPIQIYMYALLHYSLYDHLLLGPNNPNSNSGSSVESGINYAYQITMNH